MKQEYDVIVVYEGYDAELDERLRWVAEELGAEDVGSGYGFGQRDHQFRFSTKEKAQKYARRARRWKTLIEASGKASVCEVECYDCDKLQSECVCD